MKRLLLLLFLAPVVLRAQVITTVAGTGHLGYSGNGGPATAADMFPVAITFDKYGNMYLADGNSIREVSTSGIITVIAGNGTAGESGDGGPATAALINYPSGLVLDSLGNIFFTEIFNSRIREIHFEDGLGIINTVVGNGTSFFSGDGGPASVAMLTNPIGITFDHFGNMFFADGDRVRKVNTSGIISTVVGNGFIGYSGDNGPATAATMDGPHGIRFDLSNNLYLADEGNNVIRKVTPRGIITTVAGNGLPAYAGDGGQATDAELKSPWDVVVDAYGEPVVRLENYCIF